MTETNLGRIIGPEGPAGKSAYQYAQDGGFEGSEQEFTEKLAIEYPTFSNLREAAPVNLLDNSDFTNPVAQAGIGGNHGNQQYALDRWKVVSGNIAYDTDVKALTLLGKLTQTLEHPPETEVSLFAEYLGSPLSMSYEDGVVTIESSDNCLIKWVAMYEGVYTEKTKPEYRPKGYAAELTECMRYYQFHQDLWLPGTCFGGVFSTRFLFPSPMRLSPTVTIQGNPYIYTPNNGAFNANALASNPSAYSVVLSQSIDVLDTIPANMPNITLQLSADL